MSTNLLLLGTCLIAIFLLCIFIYRNTKMTDSIFSILMTIVGSLVVTFVVTMLGTQLGAWPILAMSMISGALLGFQGSRVIIKIRRIELANMDKSDEGSFSKKRFGSN